MSEKKKAPEAFNIVNQYVSTIIQIQKSIITTYETNNEIISKCDGELTDIEHEIELAEKRDSKGGNKLYNEIRSIRIIRRKAKDENNLLHEIYNFIKVKDNEKFFNQLRQIQGNSKKTFENLQTRTYTPRVRTDLTCTDKVADKNLLFKEAFQDFEKMKDKNKSKSKVVKG